MSDLPTTTSPEGAPPRPVAHPLHTAIFVAIFLGIALAGGAFQAHRPPGGAEAARPDVVPLYVSLLLVEWLLVYVVWRGIRRGGTRLRDLIGGRWSRPGDLARDAGLALLLWLLWLGIQRGFDLWIGSDHARSVAPFLPRGLVEVPLWIALSLSAGFCEELVFRGYLLRQFGALARNRPAGVVLQAVLFGVGHAYEGIGAVGKIILFGLLYGSVAVWRRSLRPGMVAHAWSDIWAGWLGSL